MVAPARHVGVVPHRTSIMLAFRADHEPKYVPERTSSKRRKTAGGSV